MKHLTALMILGLLAACGAEGDPTQPTVSPTVSVGPGGVSPAVSVANPGGGSVRLTRGGLTLGL